MLKHLTLVFIALAGAIALHGQAVPELLYYKFDGTGPTVTNFASPGVGANPATILGVSQVQGPAGQFGNGLIGVGGFSSTDYLNTGWAMNVGTGNWTISFWAGGNLITPNNALNYFFGDNTSSTFRCFTGGVANQGVYLRGGGLQDVILIPAEISFPATITYVYSSTPAPAVAVYVNGNFVKSVAQSGPNLTGTANLKVGGYSTNAGLVGILDEFRFYNRALSAAEVGAIWNVTLPFISGPTDAAVTGLIAPPALAQCFGANEPLVAEIKSNGTDTLFFSQKPLVVKSQVTGPNSQVFSDTLNTGFMVPGSVRSVPLAAAYDMSAAGVYTFTTTVSFLTPGIDVNPANDTLVRVFINSGVVVLPGVPFTEDFESWQAGPPYTPTYANGWTAGGVGSFFVAQATGTDINTTGTGSSFDNTLFPAAGGKFIFLETSTGVAGAESYLISPCIDLTQVTAPTLRYAYHMYGASMGSLVAQIDTGGVWVTVDSLVGQQQASGADPFGIRSISLTPFAGKTVRLRFKGIRGLGFEGDLSIDDVSVFQLAPFDLRLAGIISPLVPTCVFSSNEVVTLSVINAGLNPVNLSTVQATYSVTGPVNSGPVTQAAGSGTLNSGDTLNFVFATPANLSVPGAYQIQAGVSFLASSGIVDGALGNNTKQLVIQPGISGTYSLNKALPTGGTNFASFADMASAFTSFGICGPVVVQVAPNSGPYTEQLILPQITGMSATSTVTIQGNGNALEFLATNTNQRGTLILDGADYFTFDSLRIVALGQASNEFGWGVWLTNNADFNTFHRCEVQVTEGSTSTNYAGIVASNSATSATNAGQAAKDLVVTQSTIDGGYYGIIVSGPSSSPFNTGVVLNNNLVRDYYMYGVYVRGVHGGQISGNEIIRENRSLITTTYPIYLTSGLNNTRVERNHIHSLSGTTTTSATAYGIFGTGITADPGQELLIANNLIYGFEGMNGANYGINLTTTSGAKVYHNTVSVDNVLQTGASLQRAFSHSGANAVIDMRNNIFSVTTNNTGPKHCLYFATSTAVITSNYNVLHMGAVNGSNSIGFLGTSYATLPAWQGTNLDLNSLGANPVFSTNTVFPTSPAINNSTLPLAGVPADYFGTARGLTPDPGAVEFTPTLADGGVTAFNNLISGCGLLANTPVTVSVTNYGIDTLTSFSVTFRVGAQTVTEVVNTTLLPGNTLSYTFTGTANLGVPGTYVFDAWTSVPGDINFLNDTLKGFAVVHSNAISTFPYSETFDNWPLSTGSGAPVVTLPGNWINSQADQPQDWIVFSGATPNTGTGPLNDHTQGTSAGKYLYVEDTGFDNDSVILITPCFEVAPGSTPVFSFWYHSQNATQPNGENFLHVDVLTNGSLIQDIIAPIGHKGPNWNFVEINMSAYPGAFAVRFRVSNNNNGGSNHDIAIDDVGVRELLPIDAGVASLLSPQTGCGLSASGQVVFAVENFGSDTLTAPFQLAYQITGPLNLSGSVPVNAPLAPGDQAVITLAGVYNFSVPGTYEFVAWTQGLAGEGNLVNDTLIDEVVSIPVVTVYPYSEDFESGNGGWLPASNNGISSWELGTPSQPVINSAASGVNAWTTGLTTNHLDNEQSFVVSPCLDFTGLVLPALSMEVWWNTVSASDGAQVQASIDGGLNWTTVGTANQPDWYNSPTVTALAWTGNSNGWSGRNSSFNGSAGWRTVTTRMPTLAGQGNVRLRVVFSSTPTAVDEGFAFDHVVISDVPAADATVMAFNQPLDLACTDDSIRIEVALKNNGRVSQTSVPVTVQVAGPNPGLLNATYTGPFPPDTTVNFLVGYFNAPVPGLYTLTAFSGLAGDTLRRNDTLRLAVDVRLTPANPLVISDSVCDTDSARFSLVALSNANTLQWYDAPSGGSRIFVGDTLVTPFLTQSTTYWVEASTEFLYQVGPADNTFGTGSGYTFYTDGLVFDAFQPFTLNSVKLYPLGAGNIQINLVDPQGITIEQVFFPYGATAVGDTVIQLNWVIEAGVGYEINLVGTSVAGGLFRNTAGAAYLYTVPGVVSITSPINNLAGFYYFFYDWQISSSGCRSARVPVEAHFRAPFTVDLGADAVTCPGFFLDAGTPGAVSYVWNNDPSVQTPRIRIDTTGTYSVVITDAFGCIATDTVLVTTLPGPIVDLGPDVSQCNEVVLNAGNPGATYSWSVFGQTGQTLAVTSSGEYAVRVEASGCVNTDTVVVTILPGPGVDLGADRNDCRDVVLDAGNSGSVYVWSNGATSQSVTLTPPFTASVIATSANGCADSDTVTVVPGPDPVVDLGPDRTACDSVVLNAGIPGATYLWSTGATSQSAVVTTSGTTRVVVTDAIGCSGQDSVVLSLNFSPDADFSTTLVSGLTYSFQNTSTGGGTLLWDFGDGTNSSDPNPTHTYPLAGFYQVSLVVTNECGSDTVLKDLSGVSIQDEFAALFQVAPNPSEGLFVLMANHLPATTLQIEVLDVQGRRVFEETVVPAGYLRQEIDLSNLAEGGYLLRVSGGDRVATFRLIRQ